MVIFINLLLTTIVYYVTMIVGKVEFLLKLCLSFLFSLLRVGGGLAVFPVPYFTRKQLLEGSTKWLIQDDG